MKKIKNYLEERTNYLSTNIAKAYRAEAEFTYNRFYPSLINDEEFTIFVRDIAIDVLGIENVFEIRKPSMGGDDFTFFLKEAKGTYLSLNNLKPSSDETTYPHHSSKFDIYEDTLYIGSGLLTEIFYRYLTSE